MLSRGDNFTSCHTAHFTRKYNERLEVCGFQFEQVFYRVTVVNQGSKVPRVAVYWAACSFMLNTFHAKKETNVSPYNFQ
jgi:hypothetical protein